MKLHRFYVGGMHDKWGPIELNHSLWINDERLINQWLKVLRFRVGTEIVLFNDETDRIYKITKIEVPHSAHLELVTELERHVPKKHVYLLWSLLKKDKNDWVLQKATELGVRNFVPVIADRSEKTGFVIERAHKIIVEAAEQCGRSDIPDIREPIYIDEALAEYSNLPLFICEQGADNPILSDINKLGILIGPEGGWTEREQQVFTEKALPQLAIAPFTLRAETAAVVAVAKLFQ